MYAKISVIIDEYEANRMKFTYVNHGLFKI